jgi:hypothetical protein
MGRRQTRRFQRANQKAIKPQQMPPKDQLRFDLRGDFA